MLWNRYKADRPYLNMYSEEHFEPGSGITDPECLEKEILRIESLLRHRSHAIIKAVAFAFILDHGAIEVNPKCWFGINIAGLRFGNSPKGIRTPNANSGGKASKPLRVLCDLWLRRLMEDAPNQVTQAMGDLFETGAGSFWPDFDHSVPDWDSVLRHGIPGLRMRASQRRKQLECLSADQTDHFDAIEITYGSLTRFMSRLADSAERNVQEDERMPMRVQCLRNLANGAPGNTYEAMQLIYLFHLIQQYVEAVQARTFGDLDRLLYPYYLKDIDQNLFTSEQIKELFQYLFVQYDYQNHPYNQPMSIGGINRNGKAIANELTDLICSAYHEADVVNLKIFVMVGRGTPDWLLERTLDQVRGNRGSYVYMNADLAPAIMSRSRGLPLEPWQVGTWGCFNLNVKGGTTDCLHARINAAKPIELALNNGVDPMTGRSVGCSTGPLEHMATFEEFERAFYQQLDHLADRAITISDFYDAHISQINPAPMDSATLDYSLEFGQDAFEHGVTNVAVSCAGTAADSLAMIRKYVYREKLLTLSELRDMLNNNWQDAANIRSRLSKDSEKYGNNVDTVDQFVVDILNHMDDRLQRANHRNGRFQLGFSSIDYHIRYGEKTGATPDGRAAGDPLSKNIGASIGKDKSGLSALILSATKLDAIKIPGSGVLDFLVHPSAASGEEGLHALVQMIRTFFLRGGYAIQGNVADPQTLRDAQSRPDHYEGLQVRVTGWNWRFNDMTVDYQNEIINRLEPQE